MMFATRILRRRQLIEVTEKAAKRISEMTQENPGIDGVRLGIKENQGCAGNVYEMALHKKTDPIGKLDEVIDLQDNSRIIIDSKALFKVIGTKVDFVADEVQGVASFTYDNPNASSMCGCGTSFAVSSDPKSAQTGGSCSKSSS